MLSYNKICYRIYVAYQNGITVLIALHKTSGAIYKIAGYLRELHRKNN